MPGAIRPRWMESHSPSAPRLSRSHPRVSSVYVARSGERHATAPRTSDRVFVSKNLSNVVSNGSFMRCAQSTKSVQDASASAYSDGCRRGVVRARTTQSVSNLTADLTRTPLLVCDLALLRAPALCDPGPAGIDACRPARRAAWGRHGAGRAASRSCRSERVEAAVDYVERVGDAVFVGFEHRRAADEGGRRFGLVAAVIFHAHVVLDRGRRELDQPRLRQVHVQAAVPVSRTDRLGRAAVAVGEDVELCSGWGSPPDQLLLEQREVVELVPDRRAEAVFGVAHRPTLASRASTATTAATIPTTRTGVGRADGEHQPVPGAKVGSYPNAITMSDPEHMLVSAGRDTAISVYKYRGFRGANGSNGGGAQGRWKSSQSTPPPL